MLFKDSVSSHHSCELLETWALTKPPLRSSGVRTIELLHWRERDSFGGHRWKCVCWRTDKENQQSWSGTDAMCELCTVTFTATGNPTVNYSFEITVPGVVILFCSSAMWCLCVSVCTWQILLNEDGSRNQPYFVSTWYPVGREIVPETL